MDQGQYEPSRDFAPEKRAALIAYAQCGTATGAMRAVGMSSRTWWNWLKADKEFAAEVAAAEQAVADHLEEVARQRAVAGSDVLLIFLLKGFRPEKYRERYQHEVTGKDGGPIQHEDVTQARDRLRHRLAAWLPETG